MFYESLIVKERSYVVNSTTSFFVYSDFLIVKNTINWGGGIKKEPPLDTLLRGVGTSTGSIHYCTSSKVLQFYDSSIECFTTSATYRSPRAQLPYLLVRLHYITIFLFLDVKTSLLFCFSNTATKNFCSRKLIINYCVVGRIMLYNMNERDYGGTLWLIEQCRTYEAVKQKNLLRTIGQYTP